MNHTSIALSRSLFVVSFAMLSLGPGVVRAAECPASSPEDPQERRKLAKEWFATAEQSENAGNDAEATRAYACSYKMVAHPFTAFNLGRVAERSGDSELALKMFKAYVTLKPDAPDRDDVKARIKSLEEKMASPSETPPSTEGGAETGTPSESTPDSVTPPPEPTPPPPVVKRRPEPEPEADRPPSRVAEWVVGGAAGAALVAGVALNLAARSKMSNCVNDAAVKNSSNEYILLGTANDECNGARPLAYTSYVLFGVAAAGAVADALLLILRTGGSSGSSSGGTYEDAPSPVSFVPLPGGGGVLARGRF